MTEDFTPLEPDPLEHKFYAPASALIEERDVKGGSGVVEPDRHHDTASGAELDAAGFDTLSRRRHRSGQRGGRMVARRRSG